MPSRNKALITRVCSRQHVGQIEPRTRRRCVAAAVKSSRHEMYTFHTIAAYGVRTNTCVSRNAQAAKSQLQMGDATKDAANVSKEVLWGLQIPAAKHILTKLTGR